MGNNNEVSVNIKLELDDFQRFAQYCYRNSIIKRSSFCLIGAILGILLVIIKQKIREPEIIVIEIFVGITLGVILSIVFYFIEKNHWKVKIEKFLSLIIF